MAAVILGNPLGRIELLYVNTALVDLLDVYENLIYSGVLVGKNAYVYHDLL